jgi:hypothetical protein
MPPPGSAGCNQINHFFIFLKEKPFTNFLRKLPGTKNRENNKAFFELSSSFVLSSTLLQV